MPLFSPATEKYMDPEECYRIERKRMVVQQLQGRGISDPAVISAMLRVPRHLFVNERYRDRAYYDEPLPIGCGQTISQPYVVAYMTELLGLTQESKVLEIGTGSGYQAAILAEIAGLVYTVEIEKTLYDRSRELLESLGYENLFFRLGDGAEGWDEQAPFDGIILTAAPEQIPEKLKEQIKPGAVIVAPVGKENQDLIYAVKTKDGLRLEERGGVRFVPMR